MATMNYQELAQSAHPLPQGAQFVRALAADEPIEVSIYLKPRSDTGGRVGAPMSSPRMSLQAKRTVEHADDVRVLTDFAAAKGLTVSTVDPARRLVKLAGPAHKMQAAFGVTLSRYSDGTHEFRAHSDAIKLPPEVHDIALAVLGLDTRPAARPLFVRAADLPRPAVITSHFPNEVGQMYGFPTSENGNGQCIGMIELGGGFNDADNNAAFAAMGLATPSVLAMSVDGGQNSPGTDRQADGEVALDIQVTGGVAPGARLVVYFAPNTFQGFVDAVSLALHDSANRPGVLSISWGLTEQGWPGQAMAAMESVLQDVRFLKVGVFVASGDLLCLDGVNDGRVHVDYPSSSPSVFGCGGTTCDTTGNTITSEFVWNDGRQGTGGGISDNFGVPWFQANAGLPVNASTGAAGRGVPDVAGNAAGSSGYNVTVNGASMVFGGTSAVAPLWAGLTALLNQAALRPLGFYLPELYENPGLLRDITSGDNRPSGSPLGYSAGAGWDACTGLGVPIGDALRAYFKSPYRAVYAQGDPGGGIGGYDLLSPADRVFAFDYDHSGKPDHLALYRPGTGTMWILQNVAGQFSAEYHEGDPGNGIGGYDLHAAADRAFAFDYDHSGRLDHLVLYRPGTGTLWILQNRSGNFSAVYQEGDPGNGIGGYDLHSPADRAFAFDYDHSGRLDHLALYRPGTGTFWILRHQNGSFDAVFHEGDPGNGIGGYDLRSAADRAFAFDYDSSGKLDHIVLYRPGTGTIWILRNNNGNFEAVYHQGDPGTGIGGYDLLSPADRAFALDFDGTGKLDHLALYRPETGTFWVLKKMNGNFIPVYHEGDPGSGIGGYDLHSAADLAFAFDYQGSGRLDELALYRPGTGTIWIMQRE